MCALFLAVLSVLPLSISAGEGSARFEEKLKQSRVYMDEGNFTDALALLYELENQINNDANPDVNDHQLLSVYSYQGRILCLYNDFASAIAAYEKALELKDISPDAYLNLLGSYAVSACSLGDEGKARAAADKIAAAAPGAPFRKAFQLATVNGYIEKTFGSPERSAEYFKDVLRQAREQNLPESTQLTALSELVEYYDKSSQTDSTLKYLQPYVALADKYHNAPMIADARRAMLRAYIQRGDTAMILRNVSGYLNAVDSVYRPAQFIALTSKHQNKRMVEANSTIENLQLTVSWQKGLIILLIVGAALVLCAVLLWRHYGKLQREIYQRNREIVALEEDDEVTEIPQEESDGQAERNRAIMQQVEEVLKDKALYTDPDFSLPTLAKLVHSNTKYLSQAINESTGQNFKAYINRLRIYEARKRLTDDANFGHLTIQAVGESVGFRSTSNFIIAFKKVTGLAPSLYLKMVKEDVK